MRRSEKTKGIPTLYSKDPAELNHGKNSRPAYNSCPGRDKNCTASDRSRGLASVGFCLRLDPVRLVVMPAIMLGTGPLPGNHAGGTTLEVHLLPEYPDTPISLAERWGTQSTGGGFTLQGATEYRWEEHLRACGCDWLRAVANEERLSGRIFTPEEILQRRPAAPVMPPPLPTKHTPRPVTDGTLERIRTALAEHDFEEIEGLRDVLTDDLVRTIASEWSADLDWDTKDAYAALLLDQTSEVVRPIFRDALDSPTVESRAYAVCVLTKDFSRFDDFLIDGGVAEEPVDAAVAEVKAAGL